MAESQQGAERWNAIVANASLGIPMLPTARHRLIRRIVTKLCWPLLGHQVKYNQLLLAELVELRDSLVGQINEARSAGAAEVAAIMSDTQSERAGLAKLVERHDWAVEAILPTLERNGYAIDAIIEKLEILEEQLADVAVDRDLVHQELELAQQQSFARMHDGIGAMRTDLSELGRRIDDSVAVGNEAASRADAVRADIAGIRWRLAEFDVLMDVVRRAMPEAPTLEQLSRAPRPLDSLYGALEEVMRGTHEVVVERVRPYVEDIAVVGANGPVIDVGCGRGEWLEVLRDAGVESYGIDINPVYEGLWASKSLDVRVGDVREHLEKLKPGSVRAISALHVVEHLPTDDLLEFLSLALRALAPGGLILLETPNPENLLVGAWSFYLDPTHRQPIPARLLAFFVGSRGFSDVQTRYLTRPELALVPTPDPGKPWGQDVAPVVEAINQHLFAPQDYAVLARRA